MDFVIAVFGAPLLLGALFAGVGLLVDRVAGGWLPWALLPPMGFAGLIGITQFTVASGLTGPTTVIVVPVAAAAGLWLGRARLRGVLPAMRQSPWALLAAAAAYSLAIAPVLLASRLTLPGFLLDTTSGVQLAGAEHLVEHGRDFTVLPESSYRLYLEAYFGTQYPSGPHVVLGVLGRLLPVDLLWLYQPFLSCMLALSGLTVWSILGLLGVPRLAAALGAVVAAVPALVYAYALMGAIKEIALLPLLLLLFALLLLRGRWLGRGIRAIVPIAVAVAAGLGTIGLAFGGWLAVAGAVGLAAAAASLRGRRVTWRAVASQLGVLALVVVVLSLPTVGDAASLKLAQNLSQSNAAAAADPGNLLQPLHWFQVFGVWLHGSHRVDPPAHYVATVALTTVVGVAAAFGLVALLRRRQWTALGFVLGVFAVWWLLTIRGTTWTDAKLIVITSPFIVTLAVVGVSDLGRAGRRVEAVSLTLLVVFGVLWSDALVYHDTNLAPTERFEEQQQLNARFAGQGPALLTDFDEYALFEMRDLAPSGPGLARKPANLRLDASGDSVPYGSTVQIEALPFKSVTAFPLLVVRRSPERAPPPFGYVRAWSGTYYDVWRRTRDVKRVHKVILPDKSGRVACGKVRRALRGGGKTDRLVVGLRSRMIVVDPTRTAVIGRWREVPTGLAVEGPAILRTDIDFPRGGTYRVWFEGDYGRAFAVSLDGKHVGSVGYDTGGPGNYARPLTVQIPRGRHHFEMVRGGGNLEPGNGHFSLVSSVVFEQTSAADAARRTPLARREWRRACTPQAAWVEVVGSGAPS